MCGIVGIWHLDERTVDELELETFTHSLRHRGPDGSGTFYDRQANIGLGHRRLSILDLSEKGRQPMSSPDGRYHLVYNGEIYNFLELHTELLSRGYTFQSHSDTEVLLAAFCEWGEKCMDHLNGMWALAIWDSVEEELFLSRDRFGVKPLYFLHLSDKLFAFASETIAFASLLGYRRVINDEKLQRVITDPFSLEGRGYTIFDNVYQILPGHYLKFSRDVKSIKQKRWWSTLANVPATRSLSYDDQVTQFLSLFSDACSIRLRSDVSIGTALSGGIDSSSVYCTIYRLMNGDLKQLRTPDQWQKAFVEMFPGTQNDETTYARAVIDHLHGNATFFSPNPSTILEDTLSSIRHFDSVYLTPFSVLCDIYRTMQAEGIKVSLDGHGADEMLFGYPQMMEQAYRYIKVQDGQSAADEITRFPEELHHRSKEHPSFVREIYHCIPASTRKWIRRRIFGMYELTHQVVDPLPFLGEEESLLDHLNPLDRSTYETFHYTTLPTILRNFDRASMRYGVESRMPFLDWHLVRFVFSLPVGSKIHDGFSKRILRDAMRGILPESIRTRKSKIGLNAPMIEWFEDPLKNFILDTVSSETFLRSSIWDGKKLARYVEQNMNDRSWTWTKCVRLWPFINAAILLEQEKF